MDPLTFYKELQNQERPNWEQYFMSLAVLASSRSPSPRLHVGCVLVREKRVLATGYNGYLPGHPNESIVLNGHELACHAEENAIIHAAKQGISVNNASAYVTHFPCIVCTKLLLGAGIKEVIYLQDYKIEPVVHELFKRSQATLRAYSHTDQVQ